MRYSCSEDKSVVATYRGGKVTQEELELRAVAAPDARGGASEAPDLAEWKKGLAEQIALERSFTSPERFALQAGTLLKPSQWRIFLVGELMRREGMKRVEVPDDSVAAFYEENWARFFVPESAVFQHVFLSVGEDADDEERKNVLATAESVRALAASGADFDQLVEQYSKSESKGWQGKVGTIFRGQLPMPIERVVFSLDRYEVGGPISTEYGYHVVKVIERGKGFSRPFDEVSSTIRQELALTSLEEIKSRFLDELESEIPGRVASDLILADEPDTTIVLEVGLERANRIEVLDFLDGLDCQPGDTLKREQLLNAVVRWARLYQYAISEGIADDEIVAERYLMKIGTAVMDSVVNERLRANPPDEDALREFFEENRIRFSSPKTWHVSEIVITTPDDKLYEAWQHAVALVERARNGEDFGELAKRFSASPSSEQGGDLGPLTLKETMLKGQEFQKCLFSLDKGEVSDPVREKEGYLILRFDGSSEPVERSFAEARELVREEYASKHRKDLVLEMRRRLLDEIGFQFKGAEQ